MSGSKRGMLSGDGVMNFRKAKSKLLLWCAEIIYFCTRPNLTGIYTCIEFVHCSPHADKLTRHIQRDVSVQHLLISLLIQKVGLVFLGGLLL
jgi:hypothetical protein